MKFMKDSFSQESEKKRLNQVYGSEEYLKKLRDTLDHINKKLITEERGTTNGCKIIKTYHNEDIVDRDEYILMSSITTIKKPFVLILMNSKP